MLCYMVQLFPQLRAQCHNKTSNKRGFYQNAVEDSSVVHPIADRQGQSQLSPGQRGELRC